MASQQGFPNVTTPFVNTQGVIQQSWLQLLISLWTRTGSGPGSSTFTSGDIKASAVAGEQTGWLECNGQPVSRSAYSSLFAVVGVVYGSGDGVNTFNVPDYRGRTLIGTNGSFPLGSTGGSTQHTLSVAEMPTHNHGVTDPGHTHTFTGTPHIHGTSDPGHSHTTTGIAVNTTTAGATASGPVAGTGTTGTSITGLTVVAATATGTNANNTTGITVDNAGSSTPFSIMNPYAPVTWLIKT